MGSGVGMGAPSLIAELGRALAERARPIWSLSMSKTGRKEAKNGSPRRIALSVDPLYS